MKSARAYAPPPPLRLRRILATLDLSVVAFARAIGVDTRSAARWLAGEASPTGTNRRSLEAWLAAHDLSYASVLEPDDMAEIHLLPPVAPTATPSTTPPEAPMTPTLELLEDSELDHFHLTVDPFAPIANPEKIWVSDTVKRAEKAIINAIRQWSILAVVAPCGAGKSTIIRHLSGRLRGDTNVRVIAPSSLNRAHINHASLSVAILRDLIGRDTSGMSMEARSELLRTTLTEQTQGGVYPTLLIDEAHRLRPDALVAIKELWDSHVHYRQLSVILVGQPPLEARLRQEPSVRELAGRTRIVRLPPLGEQTGTYLQWLFTAAGSAADAIFEPSAYKALSVRAEYPLWVNNLAVLAMRRACELGDERVTASHVGTVG